MSATRRARGVVGVVRNVTAALGWTLATVWLGGRVLWRTGVVALRIRELFAQTTRCPRGHRVPLYAVHKCAACHAISEGYLFRTCRFCGSTPSWTPCPRCGLGVRNPLR
jgi:hypothetical protein